MAKDKAPPPQKRPQPEPPKDEGLPPWMATFADMVTLLLCFFVLLLSFAQQDANKFKTLMGSIKNAFGIQIQRKEAEFAAFSPSQFERKDVELKKDDQQILGMVVELKNIIIEDPDLQRTVKVTAEDQGVVLRFPVALFFAFGSAELKQEALPLLDGAIKILKERNVNMVVRGHTSDVPEAGSLYPSNWELSSSRAAAVLRALMQRGEISASRLKAVGYADSQPLLPNNSEANRETNSRMELYLHKPEVKSW